jgi:hypothetical protein
VVGLDVGEDIAFWIDVEFVALVAFGDAGDDATIDNRGLLPRR